MLNHGDKKERLKNAAIVIELVVIFALLIIVFEPYFSAPVTVTVNPNANSPTNFTNPDMPEMMLKTFPLDQIDTAKTVPTVSFTFTKDTVADGWNLHITANNFTFTPQLENQTPVANQGHAHLYIDGVLTVVYSPWFHTGDLSTGKHTVTVALAANDHSLFTFGGSKIQSTQTINVQ